MNIFTSHKMSLWQVGILKLAVLCFGVAIGANWPMVFQQYTIFLVIVGAASGLYIAYIWMKQ